MPGYKNFLSNQIMTAENFMDYLMKQALIVAETDTYRDTELAPYAREGMACYVEDTDQLGIYDGSNWVRMATYDEASTTYNSRDNDVLLFMGQMIP